jgi:nicotinamide mononucleotide transporter
MNLLELTAALLGLACVWLTARQHIACWPVGLLMVTLYAYIFYEAKLYSDALLQVVYIGMQIYGWWAWLYGGRSQTALGVTRLSWQQAVIWVVALGFGVLVLGSTMAAKTDAAFPYVDAFATVASLIAQWWLGRKILESWLLWIVVDIVSVGLYFAKSLYPTAILYVIFLGLAAWGWKQWWDAWKRQAAG